MCNWIRMGEEAPPQHERLIVNWHRKDKRYLIRNRVESAWVTSTGTFVHSSSPAHDSKWEMTHWSLPEYPEAEHDV